MVRGTGPDDALKVAADAAAATAAAVEPGGAGLELAAAAATVAAPGVLRGGWEAAALCADDDDMLDIDLGLDFYAAADGGAAGAPDPLAADALFSTAPLGDDHGLGACAATALDDWGQAFGPTTELSWLSDGLQGRPPTTARD